MDVMGDLSLALYTHHHLLRSRLFAGLTFTLQACLPLQPLPGVPATHRGVLASMAPLLAPPERAALAAAAAVYYNHWTVRLAHIQLIVRRFLCANWAATPLLAVSLLQRPEPVARAFWHCWNKNH